VATFDSDPFVAPAPAGTRCAGVAGTRAAYLAAVLRPDAPAATAIVEAALAAGVSVDAIYLEVLAPAMHDIGVLWERAQVTVSAEHLATAITQSILATLASRLPHRVVGAERAVAVVGCGPGDFHGLGSRMVGDFLESAGWRVFDLGAAASASAFADATIEHDARLVAVSSSSVDHLDGVREVRRAIDGLPSAPVLAVGGNAYAGHPDRAWAVGAQLHAADPRELLLQLAALSSPALS
jgi:methanogenic corrinoid protein MtbC1